MRSHVEFASEASVRLAIASFNCPSPACTSAGHSLFPPSLPPVGVPERRMAQLEIAEDGLSPLQTSNGFPSLPQFGLGDTQPPPSEGIVGIEFAVRGDIGRRTELAVAIGQAGA